MTTVTVNQARSRFKSLPPSLQDAVFSLQNAEVIRRVALQNHLPEEKIPLFGEAAGLVILGFIHAEELGREIAERAGVPKELAATLAASAETRIFSALKNDLDSAYAPVSHEGPSPLFRVEEVKRAPTGGPEVGSLSPKAGSPPEPEPAERPFAENPFILHEESAFRPDQSVSNFKLEIPATEIKEPKTGLEEPRAAARVEFSGAPQPTAPAASRTEPETPRIVHYNVYEEKPGLTVDLSKNGGGAGAPGPAAPPPPVRENSPRMDVHGASISINPREANITIINPKNQASFGERIAIPRSPAKPPEAPKPPASPIPPGGGPSGPSGRPIGGGLGGQSSLPSVGSLGSPVESSRGIFSFGTPPAQKKKRSFFEWLASLFRKKPKQRIVFAPKIISATATMRPEAITPKKPSPPPPAPRPAAPPVPPSAPKPQIQPAAFAGSPREFSEPMVDLGTLTRETEHTSNGGGGRQNGNVVNLKQPGAHGQ